jgi:hypothetical protein
MSSLVFKRWEEAVLRGEMTAWEDVCADLDFS